jgi:hypothetical protein
MKELRILRDGFRDVGLPCFALLAALCIIALLCGACGGTTEERTGAASQAVTIAANPVTQFAPLRSSVPLCLSGNGINMNGRVDLLDQGNVGCPVTVLQDDGCAGWCNIQRIESLLDPGFCVSGLAADGSAPVAGTSAVWGPCGSSSDLDLQSGIIRTINGGLCLEFGPGALTQFSAATWQSDSSCTPMIGYGFQTAIVTQLTDPANGLPVYLAGQGFNGLTDAIETMDASPTQYGSAGLESHPFNQPTSHETFLLFPDPSLPGGAFIAESWRGSYASPPAKFIVNEGFGQLLKTVVPASFGSCSGGGTTGTITLFGGGLNTECTGGYLWSTPTVGNWVTDVSGPAMFAAWFAYHQ